MFTPARIRRLALATLSAVMLAGATPIAVVHAQMPLAGAAAAALSRSTVLLLQESLNKQGATIKVDGVLGDETRAAIRQFQSQHHLPVTGEPDQATLDKLGVADRGGSAQAPMARQRMAMPGQANPQAGGMQGGMMRGGMMQGHMAQCHAMHQQMQAMMTTMQDMMKSMQAIQSHMHSAPKSN